MRAAPANNRGEINTRKHIGVKDTHTRLVVTLRRARRVELAGRGMHEEHARFKVQRRVRRRVSPLLVSGREERSLQPLVPADRPPSLASPPSIRPSVHPSLSIPRGGRARCTTTHLRMGLGVQEPSPPQPPSWHGPGRPNERGREPFLPAPRAPTPPALPRQPRLGVGLLRLLRGSIHGNPPPRHPSAEQFLSFLDATRDG